MKGKSKGGAGKTNKKLLVLVFGETKNEAYDAKAVAHLVRALLAREDVKVEPRREFLRLVKGNVAGSAPAIKDLTPLVKAARVLHDVIGVVKHEDTDEVEPSHLKLATAIEGMASEVGVSVYAAVAAWELEAWFLQWPEQVGEVRPSWVAPNQYVGKSVGSLSDAKQKLERAVRPAGLTAAERQRFPDYKESDSVEICKRVREAGMARTPKAKSESYDRFVGRMDALLLTAA